MVLSKRPNRRISLTKMATMPMEVRIRVSPPRPVEKVIIGSSGRRFQVSYEEEDDDEK